MAAREELSDEQLLTLLRNRDVDGLSASKVGKRLGRSRSAVCGLWYRVDRDTAAEEERPLRLGEVGYGQGPVAKPENMDGGMPDRWWTKGLRRQGRSA